MGKIMMLAQSNLRKNKSQMISLICFIAIATLLLYVGLVLIISYGNSFDKRTKELNSPHMVALQTNDVISPEQLTYIEDYPNMETVQKIDVLTANGQHYLSDTPNSALIIFQDVKTSDTMNPLTFIGEHKELEEDSIYIPYLFKVIGGYELGDNYQIDIAGKELHFTIAGFTEDLTFGAIMVSAYRYYISNSRYLELAAEMPFSEGSLTQAQLSDKDSSIKLIEDLNELFLSNTSVDHSSVQLLMDFALIKTARVFMASIMAALLVGFAAIILIVCIIVFRFSINNSIDEGMINIGVLKAMGYKSRQIISSIALQYGTEALIGGILGIAAAQALMPVISKVLESQSAIIWTPDFEPFLAFTAMLSICLCILLVAILSAKRIKKLHPLIALRQGLLTHSFRKNHLPLEQTKGHLPLLLGIKALLHNKKQAFTIAIVVTAVTYVSISMLSMYYNIGVEPDGFRSAILGEMCDVSVTLNDGEDTDSVMEDITNMSSVTKVLEYQYLYLIISNQTVFTIISKDFSQLEVNTIIEGRYPKHENEVTLNPVIAKRIDKKIGDYVSISSGENTCSYLITGFSQSMNNAGVNMLITDEGIKRLNPDFKFSALNIYLDEDVDIDAFIEELKIEQSNVFSSTTNFSAASESQFSMYGTIFGVVAFVFLLAAVAIVFLVLYMVIKASIMRGKRELGIKKALGFTTLQLMNQFAIQYLTILIPSICIGGVIGYFSFNSIFTALLSSTGILKTHMPSPLSWSILTCCALIIIAYIITMLISFRIRKVSPYALVSE